MVLLDIYNPPQDPLFNDLVLYLYPNTTHQLVNYVIQPIDVGTVSLQKDTRTFSKIPTITNGAYDMVTPSINWSSLNTKKPLLEFIDGSWLKTNNLSPSRIIGLNSFVLEICFWNNLNHGPITLLTGGTDSNSTFNIIEIDSNYKLIFCGTNTDIIPPSDDGWKDLIFVVDNSTNNLKIYSAVPLGIINSNYALIYEGPISTNLPYEYLRYGHVSYNQTINVYSYLKYLRITKGLNRTIGGTNRYFDWAYIRPKLGAYVNNTPIQKIYYNNQLLQSWQ